MARRKTRKKKNSFNIDIACAILICIGIFLSVVTYGSAGKAGEIIKSITSGFLGKTHYIFPIALIILGIYVVFRDKNSLIRKSIQYSLLLITISSLIFCFSNLDGIEQNKEFFKLLQDAYIAGNNNIGGGVLGSLFSIPLLYLFGQTCTIVIYILLAFMLCIFITGFKISDIIISIKTQLEEASQNTNSRKTHSPKDKLEKLKKVKNEKFDYNQLDFDLDSDETPESKSKLKKSDIKSKLENKNQPKDEDEDKVEIMDSLFKKQEIEKEDKSKEVLVLEHTLTSKDDTYTFPPMDLLQAGEKAAKDYKKELEKTALKLQKTLASFGVEAKVINVAKGPTITRYELQPKEGVKVSKIAGLSDDIALNLAATSIRIEAPIPGKAAVGIEIPNKSNDIVHFRDIIDNNTFKNFESKLAFGLGKDIAGDAVVTDIAKMPHVLIAGSTGSRKICMYKYSNF